jgi:hypothetical protein
MVGENKTGTSTINRRKLLLTKFEAARELKVSRDPLNGLIERGEIGMVEIDGQERIPSPSWSGGCGRTPDIVARAVVAR